MVKAVIDTMVWAAALARKSKYHRGALEIIAAVDPIITTNIALELYNVLTRDLGFSAQDAAETVWKIMQTTDTMDLQAEHAKQAVRIASEHRISVFDAAILTEASMAGAALVTFDRKLKRIGTALGIHILP